MNETQFSPYNIPMAAPSTNVNQEGSVLQAGLSKLSELNKATAQIFDKMVSAIAPSTGIPAGNSTYLPAPGVSFGTMGVPFLDAFSPRLDRRPMGMMASEWAYNAPVYGQSKRTLFAGDIAAGLLPFVGGPLGIGAALGWGFLARPLMNNLYQDVEVSAFRQAASMYRPSGAARMVSPTEILSGNTFELSQAQRNYNAVRQAGRDEKWVTKEEYDSIVKNLMTSGLIDLTTSDMEDLKDRVKDNVKAVKEISEILHLTLDESVTALADLKRAGIVGPTTGTTAMLARAVSMQTGMDAGALIQLGASTGTNLVQAGYVPGAGLDFASQIVSATYESYKIPELAAIMDTMGGPEYTSNRLAGLATNLLSSPQAVMLLGMTSPTDTGIAPNTSAITRAVTGDLPYSQLASRAGMVAAQTGITDSYGVLSELSKSGKNTNEILFMIVGLLKSLVTEYSQYTRSEATARSLAGNVLGLSATDVSLLLKTFTPDILSKVQEQQFGAYVSGITNEATAVALENQKTWWESVVDFVFPPERETFADRIRTNIAYDRELEERRREAELRAQIEAAGFTEYTYGPAESYSNLSLPMNVKLNLIASSLPGAPAPNLTTADLDAQLLSQRYRMEGYDYTGRNTALLEALTNVTPGTSPYQVEQLQESLRRLSESKIGDLPNFVKGIVGEMAYTQPDIAIRSLEAQRSMLTIGEQYTKLPDTYTVPGADFVQQTTDLGTEKRGNWETYLAFRDEANRLKRSVEDDTTLSEEQKATKLKLIDAFFSDATIANRYANTGIDIYTESGFRTAVNELASLALSDDTPLLLYGRETGKIGRLEELGVPLTSINVGPEELVYARAGDIPAEAVNMFTQTDIPRMAYVGANAAGSLLNRVIGGVEGLFSSEAYAERRDRSATLSALADVMMGSYGVPTLDLLGRTGAFQAASIPEVPFEELTPEAYAKAAAGDVYQLITDMAVSSILSGVPETNTDLRDRIREELERVYKREQSVSFSDVPASELGVQMLGFSLAQNAATAPALGRVGKYGYLDEQNPYLSTAQFLATETPDRFMLAASGIAGSMWGVLAPTYLDEEGGITTGNIRGAVSKTAGMTMEELLGIPEDFRERTAIDQRVGLKSWVPTEQQAVMLASLGEIPVLGAPAVYEAQQIADREFGGDINKALAYMYFSGETPQFTTQVDEAFRAASAGVQYALSNVTPYQGMSAAQIQNQITERSAQIMENITQTRMLALATMPNAREGLSRETPRMQRERLLQDYASQIGVSTEELRSFVESETWEAFEGVRPSVAANIAEGVGALQTVEPEVISRLYGPFADVYGETGTYEEYLRDHPGASFEDYSKSIIEDYAARMNISHYESAFYTPGEIIPGSNPQAQLANQAIFVTRSMLATEALQYAGGDRTKAAELYEPVFGAQTFKPYAESGKYVTTSMGLAQDLLALEGVQTSETAQQLISMVRDNPQMRQALELKYGKGAVDTLDYLEAFMDRSQLSITGAPEMLSDVGGEISDILEKMSTAAGGTAGDYIEQLRQGYTLGVDVAAAAYSGDVPEIKELFEGTRGKYLRGLYGEEQYKQLTGLVQDIAASEVLTPEQKSLKIYELINSAIVAAVPQAIIGDASKYGVVGEGGAAYYLDYQLGQIMPTRTDESLIEITRGLSSGDTSGLIPTMEKLIETLETLTSVLPEAEEGITGDKGKVDLTSIHNTLKEIVVVQDKLSGNLNTLENIVHQGMVGR